MLDGPVLDVVERLDSAPDIGSLTTLLLAVLENAGLPHVAYVTLSATSPTPCRVSTYPVEWSDYYRSRRYDTIDPVFLAARVRRRPFLWSDVSGGATAPALSGRQRSLLGEAAATGLAHGLSVPLFGPGGEHAVLSVASPEAPTQWAARPGVLGAIATQFHLAHRELLEGASTPVDPPPAALYPREREVLLWCARGKTSWEIGRILNLAERTVDHYAEAAMRKLAVNTRIAAVLKATRQGLICP